MNINIVNRSENPLPKYARHGDAGMDICAAFDDFLAPFNWKAISYWIVCRNSRRI